MGALQSNRRHCQPFAVPNRGTAVSIDELSSVLGGSADSSFVIPFLPFPIRPFVGSASAGSPGLVSAADRHSNTERKFANVGKGVGEIRNV